MNSTFIPTTLSVVFLSLVLLTLMAGSLHFVFITQSQSANLASIKLCFTIKDSPLSPPLHQDSFSDLSSERCLGEPHWL